MRFFLTLALLFITSLSFAEEDLTAQAMAWKYGAKVATDNKTGRIIVWEHDLLEKPGEAQVRADVAQYKKFLKNQKEARDSRRDQLEINRGKLISKLRQLGLDNDEIDVLALKED